MLALTASESEMPAACLVHFDKLARTRRNCTQSRSQRCDVKRWTINRFVDGATLLDSVLRTTRFAASRQVVARRSVMG